ncbi:MAG: hypothetical protein QNL04_07485 [SAR324 cluster bacterium]|nr:hypothetical protein [SAR324 cluster bacterium]
MKILKGLAQLEWVHEDWNKIRTHWYPSLQTQAGVTACIQQAFWFGVIVALWGLTYVKWSFFYAPELHGKYNIYSDLPFLLKEILLVSLSCASLYWAFKFKAKQAKNALKILFTLFCIECLNTVAHLPLRYLAGYLALCSFLFLLARNGFRAAAYLQKNSKT